MRHEHSSYHLSVLILATMEEVTCILISYRIFTGTGVCFRIGAALYKNKMKNGVYLMSEVIVYSSSIHLRSSELLYKKGSTLVEENL